MSKTIAKRVFSGVQPSGTQVHIGNYFGAMKHFVELAKEHETIICIVDLHALTSVKSASDLRSHSASLAAAYLAIGIDPRQAIIFRQSDVPEVCELAWYLACHFPLGLLERAHAVKDAKAKNININSGVMFYPILMAADILLYKASLVPVGADQKQHVEMTRDVAERFNLQFGSIFPVPEALITEETGVIRGIDGRKMSKSYDNFIGLFEEPSAMRKKVMRIVTDSKSVDDVKDPEQCNVFQMFKLFASKEACENLARQYREGGMGYGVAKKELFDIMQLALSPFREKYNHWVSQKDELEDILLDGAKRARKIATQTISAVRLTLGTGSLKASKT